jgi:hypothetical protein
MINWLNINQSLLLFTPYYDGNINNIFEQIINNYNRHNYETMEYNININIPETIDKNEWYFTKTYNDNIIKITCIKNNNNRIKILYISKNVWIIAYQNDDNYIILINDCYIHILTNKYYLYKLNNNYDLTLDYINISNSEELYNYMKIHIKNYIR